MKKFWKKHKHTFKYSLGFTGLFSIIFPFIVLLAFRVVFYLGYGYRMDTHMMRSSMLFFDENGLIVEMFVILGGYYFVWSLIPGMIGGFILNSYSLKDIASDRDNQRSSFKRGAFIGGLAGFLIILPNIYEGLVDLSWNIELIRSGLFPGEIFFIILGIFAILLAALAGGLTGHTIHAENLKRIEAH